MGERSAWSSYERGGSVIPSAIGFAWGVGAHRRIDRRWPPAHTSPSRPSSSTLAVYFNRSRKKPPESRDSSRHESLQLGLVGFQLQRTSQELESLRGLPRLDIGEAEAIQGQRRVRGKQERFLEKAYRVWNLPREGAAVAEPEGQLRRPGANFERLAQEPFRLLEPSLGQEQ